VVDALEETYSGCLAEEVSQGSVPWVTDGHRAIYDISHSLDVDDVVSFLMIDLTGSVFPS
jgi:hypothetical protein